MECLVRFQAIAIHITVQTSSNKINCRALLLSSEMIRLFTSAFQLNKSIGVERYCGICPSLPSLSVIFLTSDNVLRKVELAFPVNQSFLTSGLASFALQQWLCAVFALT